MNVYDQYKYIWLLALGSLLIPYGAVFLDSGYIVLEVFTALTRPALYALASAKGIWRSHDVGARRETDYDMSLPDMKGEFGG